MASDIGGDMIALLPRLRRFARGLSRSQDEADDLVQAACERAIRAADSFEPGTRFDSWMFRIIRNLRIDQARRMSMIPLDDEIDLPGEDGRRTVGALLELREVRAGITALPDELREVLLLVCVEDMSYREAAGVLDIPVGTVMSRLARARQALAARQSGEETRARKARRSTP
jgi:RNA polymerase sigma-70 factor (ECF subfamily)